LGYFNHSCLYFYVVLVIQSSYSESDSHEFQLLIFIDGLVLEEMLDFPHVSPWDKLVSECYFDSVDDIGPYIWLFLLLSEENCSCCLCFCWLCLLEHDETLVLIETASHLREWRRTRRYVRQEKFDFAGCIWLKIVQISYLLQQRDLKPLLPYRILTHLHDEFLL